MTKTGDYIVSTLQMGIEVEFEEGKFMQMPEYGIDGYYHPTAEELASPFPILKEAPPENDELNVIDSEGGENELGTEFGEREN